MSLDKDQIARLKELAEKATRMADRWSILTHYETKEWNEFSAIATPQAVLELIDVINQCETNLFAERERCKRTATHNIELRDKLIHLHKEADWLAQECADNDCPHGCPSEDPPSLEECAHCWREAARKAVEGDDGS